MVLEQILLIKIIRLIYECWLYIAKVACVTLFARECCIGVCNTRFEAIRRENV